MLGFLGSLHFPTGALTQQGSAPSDRGVESVNGKSEIKKAGSSSLAPIKFSVTVSTSSVLEVLRRNGKK